MEKIGFHTAKTHLPRLIKQVQKGAVFIITKHGVPVAVLKSYEAEKQLDTKAVIENLYQLREKNTHGETTLREMIEEGRK